MAGMHAAPRRERRLAAQAAVLALLVAGTTAFASLQKTVTLDVDGEPYRVSAFARTVADVLASEGVQVAAGDLVAPAPESVVVDGSRIVVRHGRELVVEIDGRRETVWTTAATVGEAIAELGLRGDARASASRAQPLPDLLRVSTGKTIHVAVDGQTRSIQTAAATVREVLLEADVVLGSHDLVSVPLDAVVVADLMIKVTRVDGVTRSATVAAPHVTKRQDDPALVKGREVVAVRGRDGTKKITYISYQVEGVEIGRTVLAERIIVAPVDEVVRIGTFTGPDPSKVPPVEPGTARAIGKELMLARGFDESEWACLDKLWTAESNWRVNAENPSSGAYGIPQSLPGSKMASVADDWRTNPVTQITWGLNYIENRYDTPCGAWAFFLSKSPHWY